MLEFDPRLSPAALEQERREILGRNRSRIYDTTAWNLTMMFGLEALTLAQELPATAKSYAAKEPPPPLAGQREAPVAYIVDGADDRSVAAAARLMEQGVQVRVADKPCRFDDREFARGSVFVTRLDNRQFRGDLAQTVAGCVQALGLSAMGVSTGFGPGDLPDLGGEHFRRLEPPRIALLGRGGFNSQDYGAIWYVLDHHLGARHSHLDEAGPMDLSRYNVLVAPAGRGGGLASNLVNTIKEWVKTGGSLIVVGDTAASFMADKADFSKVRQLPEVLNRLPEYELAVLREWLARFGPLPGPDALWTHKATAGLQYPWQALEGPLPEEKEIKRRDAWQALFMPQGALLAGRVDTNHWLTAGCTEPLPLLVGKQPILMAAEGVAAPIRYGCLSPVPKATNRLESAEAQAKPETTPEKKEKKEPPRLGWCALPEGTEMHLRMSGLLWPEAAQRLANAAWVTREPYGRGQVVIFATPPAFRASARGAERVLLNALVCGPGFGAAQPIRP
jgi:GNAT superfamily N-acetyltransferase